MLQVEKQGDVTIVELGAEYEALDESLLRQQSEEILAQAAEVDPPWVVVDLSQTKYIDSHFIEVLIRFWKRIRERDGRMVVCGLSPFCEEVIRVMQLDKLWDTFDRRDDAIKAAAA